jgi:hypothetical protein
VGAAAVNSTSNPYSASSRVTLRGSSSGQLVGRQEIATTGCVRDRMYTPGETHDSWRLRAGDCWAEITTGTTTATWPCPPERVPSRQVAPGEHCERSRPAARLPPPPGRRRRGGVGPPGSDPEISEVDSGGRVYAGAEVSVTFSGNWRLIFSGKWRTVRVGRSRGAHLRRRVGYASPGPAPRPRLPANWGGPSGAVNHGRRRSVRDRHRVG